MAKARRQLYAVSVLGRITVGLAQGISTFPTEYLSSMANRPQLPRQSNYVSSLGQFPHVLGDLKRHWENAWATNLSGFSVSCKPPGALLRCEINQVPARHLNCF